MKATDADALDVVLTQETTGAEPDHGDLVIVRMSVPVVQQSTRMRQRLMDSPSQLEWYNHRLHTEARQLSETRNAE